MLSNMSGARSRKGCDGMAKAVLVMDMPERCADCPLRSTIRRNNITRTKGKCIQYKNKGRAVHEHYTSQDAKDNQI